MVPNESEYGYLISSNRSSTDYPVLLCQQPRVWALLVAHNVLTAHICQSHARKLHHLPFLWSFPILCTQKTGSNTTTELPALWIVQKRREQEPADSLLSTDQQWRLPPAAWGCSCHGHTLKQVPSPALTFFCFCLCHSQLPRQSWSIYSCGH